MDQSKIVLIDSSYRESTYSSSTNFEMALREAIRGTTKMEIIAVDIPNAMYTVTADCNKLHLVENGTARTVSIPVGYYTISTLTTALESALGSDYSISVSVGNKVSIERETSGSESFELLVTERIVARTHVVRAEDHSSSLYTLGSRVEGKKESIAPLLGFVPGTEYSGTGTTVVVTAGNVYDLLFAKRYAVLKLTAHGSGARFTGADTSSDSFYGIHCIASIDGDTDKYTKNGDWEHTFSRSLDDIRRLQVQVMCPDGSEMDLNGKNISIAVKFTCSI